MMMQQKRISVCLSLLGQPKPAHLRKPVGFTASLAKRNLMLHEYQAAQLVHKYMIPIPLGTVAFTAKEAFVVARKFGPDFRGHFVVKAQVQGFLRTKGVF